MPVKCLNGKYQLGRIISLSLKNRLITILKIVIITVAICFCGQSALAESAASVIGKTLRYCNPLSIETSSQDGSPRGVSLGDVTIVRENNRYYMFCTGGGAWVSGDLIHWKYSPVQGRVPVAPGVVKYNGYFYMSGNGAPLYRAKDILGPYEEVGNWKGNPNLLLVDLVFSNSLKMLY